MQSVSGDFTQATKAGLREPYWLYYMSFAKSYNAATTFFTIGTSTIGSTDIIKGEGNVVQEWDKYNYTDYSNRVIAIEYDRSSQQNPETPIIMGMADIVLDNHDDLFTPTNINSPLYGTILPKRPVKLYLGFSHDGRNDALPIFVGLTDGSPYLDEIQKTVRFHCIDFLYSIMNVPLERDVIYVNQRTDLIVASLLQFASLGATQYSLDTGTVVIPFAYFPKGTKLGEALQQIVQAELGRLYMNELGMITFENRTNWNTRTTAVWSFDKSNVLDKKSISRDNIINVVEVNSNSRTVQISQKIWEQTSPVLIPPSSSVDIFANFADDDGELPAVTVATPSYNADIGAATTSAYSTNQNFDGSGGALNGSISLSSFSQFSTGCKMTFANGSSTTGIYITGLVIWGTPAKITTRVYIRKEDTISSGLYDEEVATINNDYIQDEGAANSLAQIILSDMAGFQDSYTLTVKGVPQLQIGDLVGYSDENGKNTYYVSAINGILNNSGLTQTITIIKRTINLYFRIGISTIGGTDPIAP